MFKHSEYNINETKKFIELTKEALLNEEKDKEWNTLRPMYGLYTERDKGTYMLRPRFPGGEVSLDEFLDFVELCETFGDKRIHITTRQDIQIHGLKKELLPQLMTILLEKGYSSRATGGNAARAVIVPPMSGFEEEIFDVTPYSEMITNYILSNNDYIGLPRKYKIALSNKEENAINVKVSDLGFLAKIKNGVKGFKVYGAGGLGASSKESIVLCDFVPHDEILYHVEAMRNLFAEHGDRNNKARARIRYIAQKLGEKEFIELYTDYLKKIYKLENLKKAPKDKKYNYESGEKIKLINNLLESKIEGSYGYYLHPFSGDIPTELGRELIRTLKALNYPVELRLTYNQSLVIRGLKGESIKNLKILFDKFAKSPLEQSITCVGKSTCNLGILESPVLMKSILKHFKNKKRLARLLPTLRISGCPNSCGAQQLGNLGFWGKKKQGIEYYTIMAKGNFQGETHILNKNIGDIKASLIPNFLEDLAKEIKESGKTYKELVNEDVLEKLLENYSETAF